MITLSQLNSRLLSTHYAVRGPIVKRAQELEAAGREIIYCNIGNPQALGQLPLTYVRQVLSLIEYPELLNSSAAESVYPEDIIRKAQFILDKHPFGTGAYSHSCGITFIREAIAAFISQRDGVPINKDHIFLTDGASKGVQSTIFSLIRNEYDGLLIPIPQYPLYSATLELYGGKKIGYFLDEENNWSLNKESIIQSIAAARAQGVNPVGIVVINPGNPTGAVLDYEIIRMIIALAKEYNLAIFADEVYQENIYAEGRSFISFAKVMHDMNETDVSLFSFHSVSKGYLGECGHRGGYVEFRNIPDDVLTVFEKLQSISLCSNISGQLVTYLMISPPVEGDTSYPQYIHEKESILNSLHKRSRILADGLNAIEGVQVHIPEGAMYAFVRVELPENDIGMNVELSEVEKEKINAERNEKYCLDLLEETGICVVPGSGFGQQPGTYHFRTTFLPPEKQIVELVERFGKFHREYISKL